MHTLKYQSRLVLGALLAAVLVLTVAPAGNAAADEGYAGKDASATTARIPLAKEREVKVLSSTGPLAKAGPGCRVPRCFGAMTMNVRTFKIWGGWDYGTRYNAERSQYKRCVRSSSNPRNCRKQLWVKNGCAAIAMRVTPRYVYVGRATGYRTLQEAKRKARKQLGFRDTVRMAFCTTRRY